MININYIRYLLLIFCSFFLFACNKSKYENTLKNYLSKQNGKALCYSLPVGSNVFPKDIIFNGERPKKLLELFVNLKFLEKQNITLLDRNKSIIEGIRYKLTPQGSEYFVAQKGAFCFGNIELDKIYKIDNIEVKKGSTRVDTGKWLYYNYYFTNIPEWALDERFEEFYQRIPLSSDLIYKEKATISDDGYFYKKTKFKNEFILLKSYNKD